MRQIGVVCYICGREFGTRSIGIHEPQCIKKWETQNNKLPKNKRQTRPVKPVEFDQPISADPAKRAQQIEKINLASNAAATDNLVPCSNCGRKFLQTRIEAHEKICCNLSMTPAQRLSSNSGFYGQRVIVVDGEQVDGVALRKEKTFSSNTISKPKPPSRQYSTNTLTKADDPGNNNNNIPRGPLRTLPCQFCGKAISHNAINVHVKKCKSRSDPLPQSNADNAKCEHCNKTYPSNVISVHIRNCSAAPKKTSFPPRGPTERPAPKKQVSKTKLTPPESPATPRKVEPLSNTTPTKPYSRYTSPRGPDNRLTASLDVSLDSSFSEVEIDLVLGVDPALVITCMVCGLVVLKSKLNTHYHNYCQKPALSRSLTIPPSSKLPKPPATPQPTLVTCEICNRNFKSDVIEEHEIRCAVKNQEELGSPERAPSVDPSFATNGLSSPTHVVGKVVSGKFVPCINCGKSFTIRSLVIHQKQCMS